MLLKRRAGVAVEAIGPMVHGTLDFDFWVEQAFDKVVQAGSRTAHMLSYILLAVIKYIQIFKNQFLPLFYFFFVIA